MLPVSVAELAIPIELKLPPAFNVSGRLFLPMESSRHREILGAQAGAEVAQEAVAAAVRASVRSSSHRSASSSSDDAITRRRPNTTAPPPLPANLHHPTPNRTPPTPLRPVSLVSLHPAFMLRHALILARMCLPPPAAPSHVRRAHRPSTRCRQLSEHSTELLRDGH